jgi:hypothetical protein
LCVSGTELIIPVAECSADEKRRTYVFSVRAVNINKRDEAFLGPWSEPQERDNCFDSGNAIPEVTLVWPTKAPPRRRRPQAAAASAWSENEVLRLRLTKGQRHKQIWFWQRLLWMRSAHAGALLKTSSAQFEWSDASGENSLA